MTHTIEQYLIALVGLVNKHGDFCLKDEDQIILSSIARQVARNTALTDRQYFLVKSKLVNYQDQFERNGMIHLDIALENLSLPLRTVDRSQTIAIEDGWLVVRFPFNKKSIAQLETVISKYRNFYSHQKGSNEHRFKLYEPLVHQVIELFKNKKFEIEPQLIELSNEIEQVKNKKHETVPHVTSEGLCNVDSRAATLLSNEIGSFCRENRIKYWDRSIRYGYQKEQRYFDTASALAENLANRVDVRQYVNPGSFELTAIADAIAELDRFPLLVTLNQKKEFEELKTFFRLFSSVDSNKQILLNRIEDQHDSNYQINSFIKHNNFNKWLDKDIKIVYIFKNSLPKLLLKGEWRPITHLSLSAERENTMLSNYIEEHCDLNIYYDSQRNYWNNSIQRQLIQWAPN